MIKTTLTHSLKQSSKVDMILETGTIVRKVMVRWVGDYIPKKIVPSGNIFLYSTDMVINDILKSPPTKNDNKS